MVSVNELRRGNWVNDEYRIPMYVCQIFNSSVDLSEDESGEGYINFQQEDIFHIPLTKELLEKCGWIWNEECNSYEKYPNGDARMNLRQNSVNQSYSMFNYVLKANICKNIYFLHQLQNIYYVLTQTELPINLNQIL